MFVILEVSSVFFVLWIVERLKKDFIIRGVLMKGSKIDELRVER